MTRARDQWRRPPPPVTSHLRPPCIVRPYRRYRSGEIRYGSSAPFSPVGCTAEWRGSHHPRLERTSVHALCRRLGGGLSQRGSRAREGCPTSPTALFGQALGQALAWPQERPPATLQVSTGLRALLGRSQGSTVDELLCRSLGFSACWRVLAERKWIASRPLKGKRAGRQAKVLMAGLCLAPV